MKIYFYSILVFIASSILVNSTQQINDAFEYKNISAEINSIINKRKLTNTRYGIAIYSEKMQDFIYTHNPEMLLVPASNTKLVTTFTTYNLLKDDRNIKTKIAIEGEIIDGVLDGNLHIIGGGDALLSINDLEIIADEVRKYGINKINGNIVGDDTFFDNIYNRFHYSGDKDEVEPTAPVSALSLERNVVNVIVTSGSSVGKSVNVSFKPASSGFVISNSAVVGGAAQTQKPKKTGSINNIFIENDFMQIAGDVADYNNITLASKGKKTANPNQITITSNLDSKGRQVFYIKGRLSPNRTYTYRLHIRNPALATASALKDRLIAGGVAVSGSATKKQSSDNNSDSDIGTKIIYTLFRNINEIVDITNKSSNNYLSEMLFKLNGAVFDKDKNTAQSASMANIQALNDNEINSNGFVFNDGSGLSRRNLITAEGLVGLLLKSADSPFADDFINSLSIAGVDGTLQKRMHGSFAEGNLRAKTGTHRNVSSLAGLVRNRSDDVLYFAFIFNGGSVGIYKQIENEICMLLAEK